jgi:hypothetical protein
MTPMRPWLPEGIDTARLVVVGFHDSGPQHNLGPDIEALAAKGLIQPMVLPTPREVCFPRVL